jgi:chromosome segregation ATPase
VLYLAEVQRKTRVLGASRAEFKLLACQRAEQSWSAVPGEEVVPAPDDVSYNAGALVMVEVSVNRQIQRHSEAGRQLVSILQNFSRLQEKAKTQEEEIEQWKQSLTYQSQELNRREMEMEARQEQLQQMEEDFEKLEQQRQELESSGEEVNRLREEFERKSQELSGAWAQLRGEMARLEEQQSEMQQTVGLDAAQAHRMQELLNRLSGAVAPTETVREQLNLSFEVVSQQQSTFDHYWHQLNQQQTAAQQLQDEVEQQYQEIHHRWQEWHQLQDALEQARANLKAQQSTLQLKQEYVQVLSQRLQSQEALHQQVAGLTGFSGRSHLATKVDPEALEKMPLEELQTVVADLQKDLEKVSGFVNSQEEELSVQQKVIEKLEGQIQEVNEYDRLQLEAELADERESYQMLNKTLVGQRRNLLERQEILKMHQIILARRQGLTLEDDNKAPEIDLAPVLAQIDGIKQQYAQDLKQLEDQVQELRSALELAQRSVDQQAMAQESRLNELKQFEQQWQSKKAAAAEMWGKVSTYQETLQPPQDGLNRLREKLETIAGVMAQFQEASDYQLQAIAEMRQAIVNLTGNQSPEFIAS